MKFLLTAKVSKNAQKRRSLYDRFCVAGILNAMVMTGPDYG